MYLKEILLLILITSILLNVLAFPALGAPRGQEEILLPNANFEELEGDPSSALGKIPYMWKQ